MYLNKFGSFHVGHLKFYFYFSVLYLYNTHMNIHSMESKFICLFFSSIHVYKYSNIFTGLKTFAKDNQPFLAEYSTPGLC